jgi:hypothetical protein
MYSNATSALSDPVTTTTFAPRYWLLTAPATGRCARKPRNGAESTRSLIPTACLSASDITSHHLESSTRGATYHRASLHSTAPHLTSEHPTSPPETPDTKNRVKQAEKTGYYTTERVFTDSTFASPPTPPNAFSLSLPISSFLSSRSSSTPSLSPSFPPDKNQLELKLKRIVFLQQLL